MLCSTFVVETSLKHLKCGEKKKIYIYVEIFQNFLVGAHQESAQ